MQRGSLLENLPDEREVEISELLVARRAVKFERIVSHGQSSPPEFWYDQAQHEFVFVVSGRAVLEFENGETAELNGGDWIQIDAHVRHRVAWTEPNDATVWLVAFFDV